ncbi:MAG TPA: adaptor protein MecA [Firmicutes bacterium]|nr:adaptor protein MecA [Bacillota bacterium]
MHISLEEPGRLKITLTGAELRRFSLDYEQLDYENPLTRRALSALMAEASAETGFRFQPGRLLIEAFPAPGGGCELYFTMLADPDGPAADIQPARAFPVSGERRLRLRRTGGAVYTFEFAGADDMLAAMEQLYSRPETAAAESDLYIWGDGYRLIYRPRPEDRFAPRQMEEYASAVYRTAAAAAYTAEHGRLLAGGRAVARVGQALGRAQ